MKYIPLMHGKAGEFAALTELADEVKDSTSPLIMIVDVPWDFETDEYAKSIDEHLNGLSEKIANSVEGMTFYVDFPESMWDEQLEDKTHPVTKIFSEFRKLGATAIPVTDPDRPAEYQDAVKEQMATDNRGVCFRVDSNDVSSDCESTAKLLGVPKDEVDVLVDFESILPGQAGE